MGGRGKMSGRGGMELGRERRGEGAPLLPFMIR
jgi:hypothetical protein